jgi:hypothetical protein
MSTIIRPTLIVTLTLMLSISCAQTPRRIPERHSFFQFSFFPGISTNGVSSATFYNDISFNLLGGHSAGNRLLEIGVLTNSNMRSVSGIQVAGLANIIGANAFVNLLPMEERDLMEQGYESSNRGIQLSGLLNYVRDNSKTIQMTAGLNVVGLDFKGFQLAGFGNSAGGNASGVQVAGIYNIAHESMGGLQISTMFNYTSGRLAGAQLGLVNRATQIEGKRSAPATRSRGMQLGLVNLSRKMNGSQIGLVNFGGAMRGNQIGIINFFQKVPTKENVALGMPIGLLNIGSVGSVTRLYFSDLFPINVEHTTGNCSNCSVSAMGKSDMPYEGNWKKLNQNALIAGYDPRYQSWGFGYGFMKILLNKFAMIEKPKKFPMNARHMISYGARVMHLNQDRSFDKSFNLLTRLHLEYGHRRWFGWQYYGGISLNYFVHEQEELAGIYHVAAPVIEVGKVGRLFSSFWPGYSVGIQIN